MGPRPLSALPPSSWARNPDYVIDLAPLPVRVTASVDETVVADSDAAVVMFERGHAPVYYLPWGDLRHDLMVRTDHTTHCPYKGDASYWSLTVGDRVLENVAWAYESPYPEMAALKGLVGLYWSRLTRWTHDGRVATAPVDIAGRINETNHFARVYPDLAATWHEVRNRGIRPYEFAADSTTRVWWCVDGEEWCEPIRDRVLRALLADA